MSPPRYEYRLTRRGRDLFPVALAAWIVPVGLNIFGMFLLVRLSRSHSP